MDLQQEDACLLAWLAASAMHSPNDVSLLRPLMLVWCRFGVQAHGIILNHGLD